MNSCTEKIRNWPLLLLASFCGMFGLFGSNVSAQTGKVSPTSPSTSLQITAPVPDQMARFGESISVDGDRLAVGEPFGGTNDAGAVYIFRREGNAWTLEDTILGTIDSQGLGTSVAIKGDVLVAGAPREFIDGVSQRGAVYIYRRQANNDWLLEKKFARTDTAPTSHLGLSVAIEGDTVAATMRPSFTPGSIHVYRRVNNEWVDEAVLQDLTGIFSNGFGINVDISGNTIVAGEKFGQSTAGLQGGAVCVFVRTGSMWELQSRIPGSPAVDGRFGTSVSILNDVLVVGAEDDRPPGAALHRGAAYVYTRESGVWTQRQKLTGFGAEATQGFGAAVDQSGDRILVGTPAGTVGPAAPGTTFFFRRAGDSWLNGGRLVTPDIDAVNTYGWSVAILGNKYFTSSPTRAVNGLNGAGTVDVFIEPSGNPDLAAESDSGVSSSDNITRANSLIFSIEGFTLGSTVDLVRNGEVIATTTGKMSSVTLTDVNPPAGSHVYTSRQTTNGEVSSQSEAVSVTVDRTGPVVVVEQFGSDPTTSASVSFTIQGSEPAFGIEAEDLSFEGTTADLSQATTVITPPQVHPIPWLATISGFVANPAIVRVSLPAGRFTDAAGNPNDASVSIDNTITVDNVRPAVTINQDPQQTDPATSMPLRFKVNFSEPVTGFTNLDISFAGSIANTAPRVVSVTGNGTSYDVSVSGITSNGQIVVVSIPAGSANDALGNGNLASTSTDNTITVDTVIPTVSVNKAPEQPDPTFLRPVRFRVVFSETVTGFDASDISFNGSTVDVSAATISIVSNGNSHTVEVSNVTGPGMLRVTIAAGAVADAAGNLSSASTSNDNQVQIYPSFATLSGRITNSRGYGVRLATIKVTLPDGTLRFYRTNDFGYYHLRNLPTGRISLELTRKPTHLLTQSFDLVEDRADYNFIFN